MTTSLPGLLNQVNAARWKGNDCLIARIRWCHQQATEALTILEAVEWYAEQNGLIDALIERDCSHDYQDRPTLRERYTRGLQDGRVLSHVAKADSYAQNLHNVE